LTEPDAGSDAGATRTSAIKEGDYWRINGSKRFITNPSYANTIIITASTDREKKTHGITAFIAQTDWRGFIIAKDEHKMGLHGSNTVELAFEDLMIPDANLLGEINKGFSLFMKTLDGGRISIGAMALGLAQAALDVGIEWAQTKGIADTLMEDGQSYGFLLADLHCKVEAARMLVYEAAKLKDKELSHSFAGAMAKYYASEVSVEVANKIISMIGVDAILLQHPAQRILRDTVLTTIGEGTSEIQKLVISRLLLTGKVR